MDDINTRIQQIALTYCADYPNIKHCSALEKLYAIEQTLKGWRGALDDWQKIAELNTQEK